MIFKVGNIDYSAKVIAGSYDVQSNPVYESWTDANGTEHRVSVREGNKIEGTFEMFFRELEEYKAFVSDVKAVRLPDMTAPLSVTANNTNETVTSYFFIDFAPKRNRGGDWKDYMERFTVTITEA